MSTTNPSTSRLARALTLLAVLGATACAPVHYSSPGYSRGYAPGYSGGYPARYGHGPVAVPRYYNPQPRYMAPPPRYYAPSRAPYQHFYGRH